MRQATEECDSRCALQAKEISQLLMKTLDIDHIFKNIKATESDIDVNVITMCIEFVDEKIFVRFAEWNL